MTRTHIAFDQVVAKVTERLRLLKHLAIVEINLSGLLSSRMASDPTHDPNWVKLKKGLVVWKIHLIQVLKDSPSDERKFLRWKLIGSLWFVAKGVVLEAGELELLPEKSLQECVS